MSAVDRWARIGAANNAAWCDVVCRSHGGRPRIDDVAWSSRTRTPAYYPDAVTLVPDVPAAALLARIDGSPGCSIKDSFASLRLAAHGFRVLFDARWIVRSATFSRPPTTGRSWDVVRTPSALARWEEAWRGDDGPHGIFRPELLDHRSVTVLAASAGERIEAGAILHHSGGVVGVTNVFSASGLIAEAWVGCLGSAARWFPGATLVGYESGDALDVACDHGFQPCGPLRVWIREG